MLGVAIVLFFLAIVIILGAQSGPERVEINRETGKYRREKGWLGGAKIGNSADILSITVVHKPSVSYSACKLNWVSGRSTVVGKWKGPGVQQRALDLAELLSETLGVPITMQDIGRVKSTKITG